MWWDCIIIGIFNFIVVNVKAYYEWSCTEPVNGQSYIPDKREIPLEIAETAGSDLYVVPVIGLELESDACYGEVFTVEYCYICPSTAATFEWVLYLLEECEGGTVEVPRYLVKDSIPLQSHFIGDTSKCDKNVYCDKTEVSFELQKGFVYGVTAEEDTSDIINLAAYHDAYPHNQVDTFRIAKDDQLLKKLEVGSNFSTRDRSYKQALRMLWFSIGKFYYAWYTNQ